MTETVSWTKHAEADRVAEWSRSSNRHVIIGGLMQLVLRVVWLVCRAGGRLRGRPDEHQL